MVRFEDHSHPNGGLLLLARHGESEGNARNIFTGRLDLPLTKRGRREALDIAASLRKSAITLDIAFSSVLQRARETAEIIIASLGRDIQLISNLALNERDYGILTGHHKDLPVQGVEAQQVRRWRRSFTGRPSDGESLMDTQIRVGAYYDSSITPQLVDGRSVLVVAHGNSLRALIKKLEYLTASEIEGLEIGTGEIIAFETCRGAVSKRLPDINPTERSRIFTL
ncbi:2,3-bisphosphoglycerate-dependent phosphoglycerate mutase [Aminobacter sp. MSH1]|uniref:2,3-bisphosphoglycerate-dependent phosphoglycerate mutase n=1 Tax=Aminobacter sp. MSH1 TaxID=374606 RepID=UPI000D3BE404|nr:2,3-bisphosphoglycerate-dependent phosphoglycerate mutase [Aminobacter sp. MSH1]